MWLDVSAGEPTDAAAGAPDILCRHVLHSTTAFACWTLKVTLLAQWFEMLKVRIAERSPKQGHVSLMRIGHHNLIAQIRVLGEVRYPSVVDRPNTDPIGKDDTLATSACRALKVILGQRRG